MILFEIPSMIEPVIVILIRQDNTKKGDSHD